MADQDILIEVQVELDKALQGLQEMEKSIKATKQTVDNQLSPSTDTLGGKMQNVGNKISGLGNKIKGAIGTEAAIAFTVAGQKALGFAKDCVSSAMQSEASWSRFGALVNQNGGNWNEQSNEIKSWAKQVSNNMGYAVSDTREAAMTFLQMGLSVDQMKSATLASAGVAARAGVTESEAASAVQSALLGKGKALEKMTGLRLDDYKTADGQIDKERLLNDLYNQNQDAIKAHADTTEAQIQRMNNSWGSFKTSIGQALMPVVKVLADGLAWLVGAFDKLPGPVKTVIAAMIAIGAVVGIVVGALGFLAPVLTTIGTIITAIGSAGGIMAGLSALFAPFSAGLGVIAGALSSIILPVAAVIAAFIALYEIGKMMGWWNDLSGMISKFGEVLGWVGGQLVAFGQWLVLLFTDFPAAMAQLKEWTNNLWSYISGFLGQLPGMIWDTLAGFASTVSDAIMGMFSNIDGGDVLNTIVSVLFPLPAMIWQVLQTVGPGVSEALGGVWDAIVESLQGLGDAVLQAIGNIPQIIMDALSSLGDMVIPGGGLEAGIIALIAPLPSLLFSLFNNLFPQVLPAIQGFIMNVVNAFAGIANQILQAFLTIPSRIIMSFSMIVQTITTWLTQAQMIAGMLINMLVQAIVTRFNLLVARVRMVFMNVVTAIRTRLMQARQIAANMANMIRQAIVNRFNQIIARVRTIFQRIVTTIRQRLSNAVSAAKQKAREILNGIIDYIKQIPQKVGDEFAKIPDKVRAGLASAAQAALSGAKNIVSSFLSGMGINSPGKIQQWTEWEFGMLSDHMAVQGVEAARTANKVGTEIVRQWEKAVKPIVNPLSDITSVNDYITGADSPFEMLKNPVTTDMNLIRSNIIEGIPINRPTTSRNSVTNNNNDHTINYQIDKIELDCNNLSQEQSRRVLYNALDGLYGGF